MAKKRAPEAKKKKFYTPAEANAMLPLVRRVVEDITNLAHDLRERHQRLARVAAPTRGQSTGAHHEEIEHMREELDRDRERLEDYVAELEELGVELKDYFMGMVDFRCRMDGKEVYLCWKLDEPYVAHWHDLNTGFAGRQQLVPDTSNV